MSEENDKDNKNDEPSADKDNDEPDDKQTTPTEQEAPPTPDNHPPTPDEHPPSPTPEIQPEITAPLRTGTHLEAPPPSPPPPIDLDGDEVQRDAPTPEELQLERSQSPEKCVDFESEPPAVDELVLQERVATLLEPTPPSADITPGSCLDVQLEPSPANVEFTSTTSSRPPSVQLNPVVRPITPVKYRTSTPRAQSVKLVAPLDDKNQAESADLSAYASDAKLTDDEFIRRLAKGQLTLQREASVWRKEFNCT